MTGVQTCALPICEQSKRPGLESRLSWKRGKSGAEGHDGHIGIGGYRGTLKTTEYQTLSSWAVTADAEVRFLHDCYVAGEFYRGSSLAGLGGGAYKDMLTGIDPLTGNTRTIGLNAIGGWTQFKLQTSPTFEVDATIGQDSGYGSDFRQLILSESSNPLALSARNRMIMVNTIFRPKTYLIFSPEYRRLISWQLSGSSHVANLFTLSAGYSF